MRLGTFANPRLANRLLPGVAGAFTRILPGWEMASVAQAADVYKERGVDSVIVAGQAYGSGSARDRAAKGTRLLGVSAVLAGSFERIHRSNLIRVGVAPILMAADSAASEALAAAQDPRISVVGLADLETPRQPVEIRLECDGRLFCIGGIVDVRTRSEIDILRRGGVFSLIRERAMATGGVHEHA